MPLATVERFTIDHLSVLDAEGRLDKELEPDLDDDRLRALFRAMLLAREADERMLKLQRQGRLGTFPPVLGQEAAHTAAAFAMAEQDWLVPAFRDMGAMLLRGFPLEQYLRYYNGWEEGNRVPEGVRVLPTAVIVGSSLLHAVGLAWGLRHQGEPDTAVLTFVGDGGTSEGDFYEALNFAGVWRAPVVFVIQNNQWAISIPRGAQTRARTLAQKAIAAGIPGVQVDGNDALAVYRATHEALERARSGGGPTVIEALTYRLGVHTTADDPRKYRSEEEEQEAWGREPLKRFASYLEARGTLDAEGVEALRASCRAEVQAAVDALEAAEPPPPERPFDHVFGTEHRVISEQRAAFLAYTAKQEG
jgi:pyruvate dehydrogenase E1 component alpha subunit